LHSRIRYPTIRHLGTARTSSISRAQIPLCDVMSSLHALAFLATALLFQPSNAASSHFLAPEPAATVLARASQKEGVEISAARGSRSSKDPDASVIPLSFQELVGGFIRAEPAWLYKLRGPGGRTQAYRERPLSWKEFFVETFLGWLFWLIVALIFYACTCYRGVSPIPEQKAIDHEGDILPKLQKRFSSGHFHCFDDSSICMCSFFCPALRWSDTVSLAGFLSFWAAFAAFQAATLTNIFINGAMLGVIPAFLMLYFRQQLRGKLTGTSWTVGSCCVDFCYVCLCPCCAIAQEARIVKEGIENGYAFSTP